MDINGLNGILYLVHKGRENYEQALKKCAEETGLSKQEVEVLFVFYNSNNCKRACDIVSCRGLSKAYVSKALANLTKKGLVTMETESDRRYQKILLTDSAFKIVLQIRQAIEESIASLTAGISKEDLKIFMKVIQEMTFNVQKEGKEKNV